MRLPFVLLFLLPLVLVVPAAGQETVRFVLVAEGDTVAWAPSAAWPLDSLHVAARAAVEALAADGFALARIDSVSRAPGTPTATLYATRGPRLSVVHLAVTGTSRWTEAEITAGFDTREGEPLSASVLRADVERLLRRYEAAGFGLASVSVAGLDLVRAADGHPRGLSVRLAVDEGRAVVLRAVELGEGARTRPGYAARLMNLRLDAPLDVFDPEALAERLEQSGLFTRVGPPRVLLDDAGGAVLRLDVDEAPPGAFDLVLGLQPSPAGRGRPVFVGTGHLQLRNLFGTGQEYALRLNRLPGQVSRLAAHAAVPLVFGLPLRLEAAFDGTQQDSTYGAQEYRATAALGGRGRALLLTVSREAVKPGVGGARVVGGRQRVARSEATFVGVGFEASRLDAALNPTRGVVWHTLLERGTRTRRRTVEREGAAVREQEAGRQERLTLRVRGYHPLARRVVAVAGADGYALRSDRYEESELFRIGGATTLRGYDEDRFRVRYAGRALAEVRLLLDRLSYAFAFADVAYLDQPEASGVSSLRGWYAGYGFGAQVSTGVGLVVATYAASPEAPLTSGRVHLGLSFGL